MRADSIARLGRPYEMGAVLSDGGRYRYHLWRQLGEAESLQRVLFVMLNPSTADHRDDDPTIRKCLGFAKRWGFDRFDVANLFAWRATDPRNLRRAQDDGQDIVGPENRQHLIALARRATRIVVAWGANAKRWKPYSYSVCQALLDHGREHALWCLGTTAAGLPCHPLMLSYETPLVSFTAVRHVPLAGGDHG